MSVLDKVRKWIDGDSAELVLEQAARDAQVKPRSKAEEFIVTIAKEVEAVMQAELVPLPQGSVIIPGEYAVFLSNDDDREWQGVKRKGLEQGLYHILAERAKEIAGKKKLDTKSFVIELRIDGTLEKGKVRVQHSWEDSNANKTGVLARPKAIVEDLPKVPKVLSTPLVDPPRAGQNYETKRSVDPPPTIATIQRAEPLPVGDGEIMTNVRPRSSELYKLEVWRGGVRQNVIPIYQNEIVVGRGSKSKPVDIPLSGDVEISRRHVSIGTDGNGSFWAVNEGRNPAAIGNYELPPGQRVRLQPGVSLNVCSYMLKIRPV